VRVNQVVAGSFLLGCLLAPLEGATVRRKSLLNQATPKVTPSGVAAYEKLVSTLGDSHYELASLVGFLSQNPEYPEAEAAIDVADKITATATLAGTPFGSGQGANPRCLDSVVLAGANCKTLCAPLSGHVTNVTITKAVIDPDRDAKFVDFELVDSESGARVCAKVKSWAQGENRTFTFSIAATVAPARPDGLGAQVTPAEPVR